MNPQDFHRVEEIFQAAADLAADERAAYLDRACAGAPGVRARVDAMLGELDAGQTLDAPTLDAGSAASEGPGDVIDRYKLLQAVGEGGFGVVYMAEQLAPVRRKVALKIIKVGMDTREVVARFEAERQALALMDHPSIAKVLDGGVTVAGRPYFVMELVRGVAVTEFCDRNQVGVCERLELFVEICLAVQHAHQKGVIHRDIKPSNVLVTLYDGVPVPKVIDFGIAKAMHTPLTEKTLFTRFQRFLGTPAYMSPEQAEMSALDVDTRSDIYSLGVLLYELLTGTTPFDADELWRGGLSEIQRVLREVDPPRPSLRISSTGDAAVAGRRRLDVPGLSRWLAGDLDWIVMKALAKERGRRYGAASDLAADVRRHLADEPVSAGPPSAAYRLRKLLARRRAAVVSAALVVLALVAGVIGTGSGLLEASRQRDAARREAERARSVTDFLIGTLSLTDPEVALRPDVSVRTLLDRAAAQVEAALAGQGAAEARVRTTIGRAYASLGENELAEVHLRRAAAAMEGRRDVDGGDFYQALWSLTNVLFQLDSNDSYTLAQQARQVGLDHVGGTHRDLAAALERFYSTTLDSASSRDEDGIRESMTLFAGAAREAKAALTPGDPLWVIVADTFQAAGMSLWYGPFETFSETLFAETLEIQQRELGAGHPDTAKTLGHLVRALNSAGRHAEAELRIREAIAVLSGVGRDDYFWLAFAESLLGETLVLQGRYAEAEPLLVESHEVVLATVESEAKFYAIDSTGRLIALYSGWGREEQAAPFRAVLARVFATYKWPTPWPLARLAYGPGEAALVSRLDRLDEALGGASYGAGAETAVAADLGPLVSEIVAARRDSLPDEAPLSVVTARTLLGLANRLEAADEARRQMVEEALAILRPRRREIPLVVADALARLCERALQSGQALVAESLAREAWDLLRDVDAGGHWLMANGKVRVGRCLLRQGLYEQAEALLVPSHAALAAQFGDAHRDVREAATLVAELYAAWKKP